MTRLPLSSNGKILACLGEINLKQLTVFSGKKTFKIVIVRVVAKSTHCKFSISFTLQLVALFPDNYKEKGEKIN